MSEDPGFDLIGTDEYKRLKITSPIDWYDYDLYLRVGGRLEYEDWVKADRPDCFSLYQHLVGQECLTPFEPKGLVLVTSLSPKLHYDRVIANVVFLGNHPRGYKDGEVGAYLADELKPVETDRGVEG